MITGATLYCPICRKGMVEIAEGLYQCPWDGYGPSTNGNKGWWAVSDVRIVGDVIETVCIEYRTSNGDYLITSLAWAVSSAGVPLGGAQWATVLGYASDPEELASLPLPLVVLSPEKWELPPNTPSLVRRMFSFPLGPKIRVLAASQSGRTGSRSVLIAPTESSPQQ